MWLASGDQSTVERRPFVGGRRACWPKQCACASQLMILLPRPMSRSIIAAISLLSVDGIIEGKATE